MSASDRRVAPASAAVPQPPLAARLAALWERQPAGVRVAALSISLVAAMRVVLAAVQALSCGDLHCDDQGVNWYGSPPASAGWQGLLVGPWDRNDAVYYAQIAVHGYAAPGAGNGPVGAFFPLFPALVRLTLPLLGGDPILAGLAVNSVLAVVALVLMFRLVETDFGDAAGYQAVLLLAVGPAAFFLLAPLSEAAFLTLTLAAVLAIRQERVVLASLLAAGATLCRSQGILVMVPLVIELWGQARARQRSGRGPLRWSHATLLLPVLSLAGFQWYLGGHGYSGGLLGIESAYWHTKAAVPGVPVWDGVWWVVTHADVPELLNLLAAVGLAICVAVGWRRLRPADTAYAAASLLVIVSHESGFSPLMSTLRYAVITYPVWMLLGASLRSRRHAGWAVALLGSLTLLVAIGVSGFHLVQ